MPSLLGFNQGLLLLCFPSVFALFWFSFCLCSLLSGQGTCFPRVSPEPEVTVSLVFNLGHGFCNSQRKRRTNLGLTFLATLCLQAESMAPCLLHKLPECSGAARWTAPAVSLGTGVNGKCRAAASIPTPQAVVPGSEHRDICPAGLGETWGLGSQPFLCQDTSNACDSVNIPCHAIWQVVLKG